jgi:hypothetical protein
MKNQKMPLICLAVTVLALGMNSADAKKVRNNKQSREAMIDENIHGMMSDFPAWKKYEKAALNREVVIGMHQVLFDAIRGSWNCEEHETKLLNDRYHNQYDCTGAFSKSPKELQGRYFYTEGRIVQGKTDKYLDGTVTAIQGK